MGLSWLVLTLIAFACFVLVFLIKQRQFTQPAVRLPFALKPALFEEAERQLLDTLTRACGDTQLILAKVRAAEVVAITAIARRAAWYHANNRLAGLHFDFLLCDRQTLRPTCAVQLRNDETDDAFLNELCAHIGLPLLVFSASEAQAFAHVRGSVDRVLRG
ncbi:DUF2726 domain-containing protein [Stutzerimonas urumqiensis]|uniref:DUF2726 domain-containing protein n=1 Tax=Stutzerimonas urumqiensis TaxID=638269 RepID=UPI003BA8EF41